ncbi:MAG: arginine--tRNA ligase [Myxococcales bacterium]|nr:arginine--tRNA ligase [Myxococcales bacterium]
MAVPLSPFVLAAQQAVAHALGTEPEMFVVGTPPNPKMGDLAVGCFPAAKALKAAPPALAAKVVESFEATEMLVSATAAGPFVNFTVNTEALFMHLAKSALGDEELIAKSPGEGKSICVDFSSPNISKQLAYHHIRSTVIGHALVNLYRALGYRVVGINHLGDWGTTHGMLLAAYHRWPPAEPLTIKTLNGLYVKFREAMKEDEGLGDEGRAWFAKLENGDEEARKLWQHFKDVSWAEFETVYEMLGIKFDEVRGESAYVDDMPGVIEMLDKKGLSSVSEGALVVMLEEEGMPPLLLRKQDGATLYGTRDLAAAMYRWNEYAFERSLYVVDRGQSLHFKQLFRTLEKAGYEWSAKCSHVPFGLVRVGGKKTTTRGGNVVLLKEVFAEATERASAKISENNPEWEAKRVADTANTVGIGAIVFANIMSQRDKDVDFDWDDILSTSGDSGVYVQYGHARCCRTLEKAGIEDLDSDVDFALLTQPQERTLGLALSQLGDVVAKAADHNDPHLLSRYLLDVVSDFSTWYTQGNQDKALRVLCEDEAMKRARLSLVAMTKAVLKEGLGILGIDAPNAM